MLLASFLGTACTDGNDWNTDKSYDRLFSVTSANLSITAQSTSAEITWNAIPEAEYYIMEYSTDSLYDDIEMGGTSHSVVLGEDKSIVESPYTITGLQGETKYFFRMKSMSDHKKESRWTYIDDYAFETPGEQIFNSVATADLTESTVRLTWQAEAEVTHIDIYASEENLTLQIAELSDDYLSHSGKFVRVAPSGLNEAPAIFKKADGTYWMITSGCTGWAPNKARMFSAPSIWGPWTQHPNPCVGPNADLTFGGQSTFVLPIPGKQDAFLFMADIWRPEHPSDARYIWLPIQFKTDGTPFIEWIDNWTLDFFDQTDASKH